MSVQEKTFLQKTFDELGITKEGNTHVHFQQVGRTEGEGVKRDYEFFTSDDQDNIVIHYYDLTGKPYKYRKEGNKWPLDFVRRRLKKPLINKEGGEVRYLSPEGAGMFPFFTPGILKKYQEKKEIETLIVTEGEKKAFKGDMEGLDIVGIPSIHGFYDGDIKGKLHEDLQELIIACKVKKIIYLTDADTLTVTWAKDKDLSKRPHSFYSAVKLFRESLQLLIEGEDVALEHVYFTHIAKKYVNDGKGLDDLLVTYHKEKEEILKDLFNFQFASKYFNCKIITDGKTDKVFRHFGLSNEKEFYEQYREYIGAREFLFRGRRYEWDGENKNVMYVRHEDTEKFLRVGPDWLKVIKVLNKHGELEEEIIPFKIGEIQRDYKKYPDFLDNVPKYDAFCNEPDWTEKYKRVHNGSFNLCNALNHIGKEGEFPNTIKFLKHIFQGEGNIINGMECAGFGDQFTVGLDWISIIFTHPKQMVPVPVLVSKEYRTGKSTFLKWLQAIFESNMCILGNAQFQSKFNAHYITKFLISIDEGFLDVDKKAEKERLKQLATADTAYLENKGMNMKKFPYYGKLIICSNDADSVMKMEDGENRWFVVKVSPITEPDPDLEKKLKEEIPAFLYFIRNREIFHPREDRLWFKTDYFLTDQFKEIVENTRTRFEKEFMEMISDMFLSYKQQTMKIDLPWLHKTLNQEMKYKVDKTDIKKYLKEKRKMSPIGNCRCHIPTGFKEGVNGEDEVTFDTHPGRPFEFFVTEWLTEEQMNEFGKTENGTKSEDDDLPF